MTSRAMRVSRFDLDRMLTIPIYSETAPSLAGVFDCSRGAAYAAVAGGVVPSIRISRNRVVVPVGRLLVEVLGEDRPPTDGQIADGPGTPGEVVVDGQANEDVHIRLRVVGRGAP